MKSHLLGAAALLLTTTGASAWADISGTVWNIDTRSHRIVLNDGRTYVVQPQVNLARVNVGDHVILLTEEQNGTYIVRKITKA